MGTRISKSTRTTTQTAAAQDNGVSMVNSTVVDSKGVEESFRLGQLAVNVNQQTVAEVLGVAEGIAHASQGAMVAAAAELADVAEHSTAAIAGAYQSANRPAFDLEKAIPAVIAAFFAVGVLAWAATRKGTS